MQEITFRTVTPIFYFKLEPSDSEFLHYGRFEIERPCRYCITLKRYDRSDLGFSKLLEYTAEDTRSSLLDSIYTHEGFVVTDYFLVVDVTYSLSEGLKEVGSSREARHVHQTILDALRLHCCYAYHTSYHFRSIPNQNTGRYSYHISRPLAEHYIFHYAVDDPPVLPDSAFESCRLTFNTLLEKEWRHDVTFDKVLRLALAYHRMTFNLDSAEHRFLLLMIICDALFKRPSERNASQAAKRISALVSKMQSEQRKIQGEFFGDAPDTFYRLRNSIAHGDPNIDQGIVDSKYWTLYHYITDAILKLISIPAGRIDHMKDYYDEIVRFIDDCFASLPPS